MKHLGANSDLCYKVYIYSFPNNKVYIGMTKNTLEQRRDNGYQHNKPLQDAIKHYGWNGFSHSIVKDGLTRKQAEEVEIETIKRYDSTNPAKGYNVSLGGKATYSGLKHTDEYRLRMSKLQKGKQFSETHLINLKLAREKTSTWVIGVDEEGNRYLFKSLHDAAKDVGGYPTNVSRAIKERKKYKGLLWMVNESKGGDDGETLR